MNLKKRLTLIFSVLSALMLLASSLAGYFFARTQVVAGIEAEMTASIDAQVKKLDGWLAGKAGMLAITGGTLQSSFGDAEFTVPMMAVIRMWIKKFLTCISALSMGK